MQQWQYQHQETEGSNRTFMELKFGKNFVYGVDTQSSNRTFMELK